MKNNLAILLLLISNFSFSQNSVLYRPDRKLIADTIYQIDNNSYQNLGKVEKVILPRIYNQIKYPEIARENNFEGRVIILLSIDSNVNQRTFSIIKSDNELFKTAVIDYFSDLVKNDFIIEQVKPDHGVLNIYLPIDFKMLKDRFEENLKKNKSVTIETNSIAKQVTIIREH
jgi:hypothetical protein